VEPFGRRLRRLRLACGLSCTQLAYRVGVTEGAIRQMESGQTKIASFVVGLRLARVLGTTAWYLANGNADLRGEPADDAE
jgi:transcriptional regulator with XRE-family HTH domain